MYLSDWPALLPREEQIILVLIWAGYISVSVSVSRLHGFEDGEFSGTDDELMMSLKAACGRRSPSVS